METMTRRQFMGTAGCIASVATLTASAPAQAQAATLPAWDQEADVVVIGFGGAGAAAAITAAQENLGSCIVIEAAPEAYAGGNTSVCGQWLYIPDPADPAAHIRALAGPYAVEDDYLEAAGQMLYENLAWIEGLGLVYNGTPNPEYAEIDGYGNGLTGSVEGGPDHQAIWKVLKKACDNLGVEILYETRATTIVRNPDTNEALGVIAQQPGAPVAIKARKGVVVSCGGFEGNPDMIRQYYPIGMPRVAMFGSPYNRGDGFALVKPFGAQTWHENNFFTHRLARVISYDVDGTSLLNDYQASNKFSTAMFSSKDFIQVGADGRRYMYEEVLCTNRHGKLWTNGSYPFAWFPEPCYVICGRTAFETTERFGTPDDENGWIMVHRPDLYGTLEEDLANGSILCGETPEELATKLGLPPENLAQTIEKYNGYCADNFDPEFGRGQLYDVTDEVSQATVEPFDLVPLEPPYYAFEIRPGLLHTLGGAKRNGRCEILDTDGNVIPRLFGAGEFGSIYSYLHTSGGAVGEALATGRTAMRSACALEPWE